MKWGGFVLFLHIKDEKQKDLYHIKIKNIYIYIMGDFYETFKR